MGFTLRIVELAQDINAQMPGLPGYVVTRLTDLLKRRRAGAVPLDGAVPRGGVQAGVAELALDAEQLTAVPLDTAALANADAVLVLTPDTAFDVERVRRDAALVLATRAARARRLPAAIGQRATALTWAEDGQWTMARRAFGLARAGDCCGQSRI